MPVFLFLLQIKKDQFPDHNTLEWMETQFKPLKREVLILSDRTATLSNGAVKQESALKKAEGFLKNPQLSSRNLPAGLRSELEHPPPDSLKDESIPLRFTPAMKICPVALAS